MPQNQQQKNRKSTGSLNEKPGLQYRRSKNDDGSSDDGEFSDTSSTLSHGDSKNKYKTEEFDKVDYAKLLAELFPSKYAVNKAKNLQTHSQPQTRKAKQLTDSSSEEEEGSEENQKQYPRRSARLQKLSNKNQKQEKKEKFDDTVVKKDAKTGKKEEQFYQSKKPKYNKEDDDEAKSLIDKNGNYNIVINLQEPQFDYLSDHYDDDGDSALNDSVFDDESISSDQEDSSCNSSDDDSDDTYRESDDEHASRSGSESEYSDDDDDDDGEEQDEVTTRGFRKSSSLSAEKTENINFTINGKSIFGDEKEKNKDKVFKNDGRKHDTSRNQDEDELGSEDEATIQTIKQQMQAILEVDKNNKIARKTLEQMIEKEEKIKKLRKKKSVKQVRSNTRKFGRLLQKKNSANDLKYFKKYLTHEQQTEVLKELSELNKIMLVDKPYRLTLLESKIPQHYKAIALKRIQNLRYMDTCSGEYFKVKNWVDTFMTIPFGVHKTLPITMDVGVEQCHTFMEAAKDILDSAVYGLNDAKMQIMQMVGQWISNPSALGSAIAIKGPPGTGKTTLVKEGISKILGRDFAFIALGGATDSSFLEGHSYTYEGSTWGKIVEILIRCKSMNPVIFFDELDKLSDTPKGEEITGILTHLTDTSQNSQFHDKYFSEIAFDLSKCLFIFSYNDESKVNPILLDRMYRIHTNGYGKKDKTHIAQKYLIPKIQSEVAFKPEQIIIPDETIEYIVEHHTNKEDGVRNLKRCLEIIFTKLNLYRLMKPGSKLFDKDSSSIEVAFPFTVTSSVVDLMIKKTETNSPPMFMYT
jgi:hypothetical protein